MVRIPFIACLLLTAGSMVSRSDSPDFTAPPHRYHERTPTDRFTRLKAVIEADLPALDRANEITFVRSLLRRLEIPVSSQLLVFSTTSLQLSLISPANPRAIFFNEDTSVGYIPGGRIEVVSIDPELGAIFYIFDLPRDTAPIRMERSGRCMNCHAGEDTGFFPGLVLKSVLPGPGGGSLDSFRHDLPGHAIPFADRFGGWHVTGAGSFSNHWGNLTGRLESGNLIRISNPPGELFSFSRYPAATSDFVAHCVHEQQIGFLNRAIAAGYRTRSNLFTDSAGLTAEHRLELEQDADTLVRYLMFSEEAPFPTDALEPDSGFRREFRMNRREVAGRSLKDFNLRTRLFQHRCSYMIYSPVFAALPDSLRSAVLHRLRAALRSESPATDLAHLPEDERRILREILTATLPEFASGR